MTPPFVKITTPTLYVKYFQFFLLTESLAYFVIFLILVRGFLDHMVSGIMPIIVELWKRCDLSSKPI